MEKTKSVSGSCLCKKVKAEASSMNTSLGACHCGMCRKWSAGPYLAVDCGVDVKISGEEHLSLYQSSEWAERGFCGNCGTSIFYRMKESGQHMFSAEFFNQSELSFDHQIFIDDKPSYYEFANDTKKMTGKEVFDSFG